jgi:hypothetical protein
LVHGRGASSIGADAPKREGAPPERGPLVTAS